LHEYILDALLERFDPSGKVYRAVEDAIATINDEKTLRSLFTVVLRAETVEDIRQAVDQAVGSDT
jgi:hypothetical protein